MIIVGTSGVISLGETLGVPILLIAVSMAVAIFVFTNFICLSNMGYRTLPTARYFVTPLATMLFLVVGFLSHPWHPGWIVLPITAILTSGLVEILNRIKKD